MLFLFCFVLFCFFVSGLGGQNLVGQISRCVLYINNYYNHGMMYQLSNHFNKKQSVSKKKK